MNKTVKVLIMAAVLAIAAVAACSMAGTDESQAETVTKTVNGMTFDLTSYGSSNTAKLTAVDDSVTELIVPETVADDSGREYTVTAVGAIGGTSANHTALVSAEFPETVVSADSDLFRNCKALTKAILPGITEIPKYAFQNCSALTDVSFSDKVKSIGDYAFQSASGLTELTISCVSGTTVGDSAFASSGATGSEIHFSDGTVTSIGASIFNQSNFAVVDIDFELSEIPRYAFNYSKVNELVFDGDIKSVGENAFNYCSSLTSLVIGGKPTTLGSNFITGCSSLVDLDADFSAVTNAENRSDGHIFYSLSKLESPVVIGNVVYKIPCMEEWTVPDNVTIIYKNAGTNNSAIKVLTIPASVKTIGYQAFSNCTSLEEVEFLGKTVSFGKQWSYDWRTGVRGAFSYAFQNCASLKTATLPSELGSIPNGLFNNCPNLKIEIPDTVTDIGMLAYKGSLKGTTDLYIPSSVTNIQQSAFEAGSMGDSTIASIEFGSGSEVTLGKYAFRYNSNVQNMVMPTKIISLGDSAFYGINVIVTVDIGAGKVLQSFPSDATADQMPTDIVAIGDSALAGWAGTKITIPSTVTSIGDNAFNGCKNLTEIEIPSSVTSIGNQAFYGCTSLKTVTFSEGLKTIGNSAFQNDAALTSVKIPVSVEKIGYSAFYGCTSLNEVEFLGKDITFDRDVSYSSSRDATYYSRAFYGCTSLTKVILPSNLERIPEYIFYGCTSLSEITIPSKVTEIGECAFQNCSKLGSIKLPDVLTVIEKSAFYGCTSLSNITIPSKITSIEQYTFYNCSALETISFPDGLKSIGAYAFYGATAKLTNLTIPGSVTSIGDSAFYASGSSTLKTIVFDSGSNVAIGNYAFRNNTNVTDVTVPEKIMSLGARAFYKISAVVVADVGEESVRTLIWVNQDAEASALPNDYKSIGSYALSGWKGTEFAVPSGVVSVGDYAFSNCAALTTVSFPATLTSIGNNAFQDCSALATATFSEGLTSIGNNAFRNCSSLASMAFPASLKEILDSAFQNCSVLATVKFSEGLKTIGNSAFQSCTALTTVSFPATLTSIGNSAFQDCSALETATFSEGLTSIGNSAFQSCTALTTVSFPATLTSIGNNAFQDCSALETATFSEGLTSIGNNAFRNCSSLASMAFPASLKEILGSAFQNCSVLATVKFSEGLKTLASSSFQDCSALESVTIPESVTTVAWGAFYNCKSLKELTVEASCYSSSAAFGGCVALEKATLYGSFYLGSISSLKELNVYGGTVYLTGATSLTALKVYENTVFNDLSASSSITDTDANGTYVKVTFVNGSGQESDGVVYTSLSAGTVTLPANCVGVTIAAMSNATKAGTVIDVSADNTYLKYSKGMLYAGTSLVYVTPTSDAIVIEEGTEYIGWGAMLNGFTTADGKNYSPYIVLPSTLNSLESGAMFIYTNPDQATKLVLRNTNVSINASMNVYWYYECGTDLSDCGSRAKGYWSCSNGEYTFFEPNDLEHTNISGVSVDGDSVKFSINLSEAYSKSAVTVKVGDEVIISDTGGVYSVAIGSDVKISGVEESYFDVTVDAPKGVDAVLSRTSVLYGTEVTLKCTASSDSFAVSGYKVSVGGSEISPDEDGTYKFTVTKDLTVTVTATVTPTNVTVTYNTDGGSDVAVSTFVKGETFVFPSDVPTKADYKFYSWYLDSECTKPAAGTVLTDNITVYAKWTPVSDGEAIVRYSVKEGSGTLAAYRDGCAVSSGETVTKGTVLEFVYAGGISHEVSAWYVNGKMVTNPGDSMEYEIADATVVEITTDYYFGDISDLISESEGIKSGDKYLTAWTMENAMGYVIVGDYAYIASGTGYFMKVDLYTGDIVAKYKTDVLFGKDWPATGNGMVLDARSGIVFDLNLDPLYKLDVTSENAFYNEGYWYINSGTALYCYSAADEDVTSTLNVQSQKWKASEFHGYKDEYTLPTTLGFGKNYVIYAGVGDDDTNERYIVTVSKETGNQIDSYEMEELYKSTWNYGYIYCSEGMITVKCQYTTLFDGSFSEGCVLYRAYVDDDGNIEDETGLAIELDDLVGYGSSAVIYNGLGYIYTTGYFFVIDLDDMSILASAKCGTGDQTRTNLTLAVGEDGIVRGYNNPYTPKSNEVTRCFEYNVAANVLKTYTLNPTVAMQYADADYIKFGENGIYLMRNDSYVVSCVSTSVKVTVKYSDGTEEVRDVAYKTYLGTDGRVEAYYTDDNYSVGYDTTQRITGDLTVYAKLKSWYVEDGTLTIFKDFVMGDYSKSARAPWANEDFTVVEIEKGITSVGAYAFYGCIDLVTVSLPSTMTKIGDYAFYGCSSLEDVMGSSDSITIGKSAFDKSGLTFNILYKVDGGKYAKVEYAYGGKISAPADPSKEGYTFVEWVDLPKTMPMENLVIKAEFEINSYTVTVNYVYADGTMASESDSVKAEYGTKYSFDTEPLTGYTADKTVVSGTIGAKDETVTVIYTANTYAYTVSYVDADGKILREQYVGVAVYGTSVSPAIPKIVGYTGPAEVKTIQISNDVSQNVVEYEYTIDTHNVTVKYVFADGTKAADTKTVPTEYGKTYSVGSPAVTGYTADTAVVSGTVYLEDVSVTVRYTANTYAYTVSYIDADGKVLKTQYEGTAAYGSSVTPAVAEIAGYTGPADTKTIQISDDVSKNVVEYVYTVTVYNVTVVFDSNGGSSVEAKTVARGTAVADPGAPEFAEHVFAGWYLGDAEYDFASAVTDGITLTAKWNVREYTVTFDGVAQKVASGSAAIAPAAPSKSADANYTYAFAYWALDGREYDTSSAVYSDLELVPVFSAIAVAPSGNASEVDATKTESKVSVPESITTETVVFDTGSNTKVSVDSDGVKGKTVEVSVTPVENDTAVEGTAYEFVFSVGGSVYGKSIEVTLPYSDAPGKIPAVYYCSGGLSAQMKTVSFGDGSITFTTDHNSTYVVAMVDENSADGTDDSGSDSSDSTMMIVAVVAAVLIIGAAIVGLYHVRNNRKDL